MNPLLTLLGFAALFMLMIYFLMVRPLKQREKEHDMMVSELQPGDTVVTAGGIFGKVEKIDADSIVIEIESGRMRVTKGGVLKRNEDFRTG